MATAGELLTEVEARERAAIVSNVTYAVTLGLNHPEDAAFSSATTVTFDAVPGSSTFIDIEADSVSRISLNGKPVDPSAFADGRIRLDSLEASNRLEIDARFRYESTGVGLHRAKDPADGATYLYTHFEPFDAHKVFACFDQPDIKATYQFAVTAPKDWEVVGNTPEASGTAHPDGSVTRVFARSKSFSTYLSAIAAGSYAKVTSTYKGMELSLYCRKSMLPYLEQDEIFDIARQGLEFYEDLFGTPYPFEKYSMVFVPESNMGAMENPGCITFNENFLFRSRVTDLQRGQRANVILHEMAHMWFGDLVTMRWWNDLWLNESFATYLAFLAQTTATRFTEGWTHFLFTRKNAALLQDQMSTTHPIVADIPSTIAARQNFDGITYSKGASVLKQLAAVVTLPALRKGLQLYCSRHAWKNATLADFLCALESASHRKLSLWSKEWLESKGMNTISADITFKAGKIVSAALLQGPGYGDDILRSHTLTLGLYRKTKDGTLVKTDEVDVTIDGGRLELPVLAGKRADAVILNEGDRAYAKFRLDPKSEKTALEGLGRFDSPLTKELVRSMVCDELRSGEITASSAVSAFTRAVEKERDSDAINRIMSDVHLALSYASVDHEKALRSKIATSARRGMDRAVPGSDTQFAFFKEFIQSACAKVDLDRLRRIYEGKETVSGITLDLAMRWTIVATLVKAGIYHAPEIAAMHAADPSDFGARNALTITASAPEAGAKCDAWKKATGIPAPKLAEMKAIAQGFNIPRQHALLEPYVAAYEAEVASWWSTRAFQEAAALTTLLYPAYRGNDEILRMGERLLARTDFPPQAVRILRERHETQERLARGQALDRGPAQQIPAQLEA